MDLPAALQYRKDQSAIGCRKRVIWKSSETEVQPRGPKSNARFGTASCQVSRKSVIINSFNTLYYFFRIHTYGNKFCSTNHPDGRAILYEAKTYSKRKIIDLLKTLRGFEASQGIAVIFKGETVWNSLQSLNMDCWVICRMRITFIAKDYPVCPQWDERRFERNVTVFQGNVTYVWSFLKCPWTFSKLLITLWRKKRVRLYRNEASIKIMTMLKMPLRT